MRDIHMPLPIEDIIIKDGRREVDPAVVKRLADSIDNVGLRHPITVRKHRDQYILVAGRHRIEAFKKLDREHIPCCIVSMTNAEARMWEIAENLHRAELTKLQRAEQIEEWRECVSQLGTKPTVRETADALGVPKSEVHRSGQIASLTPEAKEAAHDAGMDDNQSALLEVAKQPTAKAQTARVTEISMRKKRRKETRTEARHRRDNDEAHRQIATARSQQEAAEIAAFEAIKKRFSAPDLRFLLEQLEINILYPVTYNVIQMLRHDLGMPEIDHNSEAA